MDKEKTIKLVKTKLWKFGYAVSDISIMRARLGALAPEDCDLLVEGTIKVKVDTGRSDEIIGALGKKFDVYVDVFSDGDMEFNKMQDQKTIITSKSPYPIFGRPAAKQE